MANRALSEKYNADVVVVPVVQTWYWRQYQFFFRFDGEIVTDFRKRAKDDKSIWGLKGAAKKDPAAAKATGERIIRDTYRVLMTRGLKGCFIYSEDEETRDWFRSQMGRPQNT